MQDLTKRQRECLEVLNNFELWRPPSFNVMAKEMGMSDNSRHAVNKHLQSLVKKGYVEKRGAYYYPKSLVI